VPDVSRQRNIGAPVLKKSKRLGEIRIRGWRITVLFDEDHQTVNVVTNERRGQVQQRI
jgi:mRNA-degrading endonuclease RelE of RelBE toxin-antitoxin system